MSVGPTDAQIMLMAEAHTVALTDLPQIVARLPGLSRRLRPFSFCAVASPLAGLLTMAQYQTATRRLSALIHVAVRSCRGTRRPTHGELNRWLRQIHEDPITRLEDPVEDVHVSNLVTDRGNMRLFQGNLDGIDYYLHQTLRALSLLGRAWATAASQHAHALLAISEAVAERAGHSRNTLASNEPRTEVRLSKAVMSALDHRVTFDCAAFDSMGISLQELSPFLLDPTELSATHLQDSLGHTHLERRPLLSIGGQIRVILPQAIGPAVQRYVIERVLIHGDQRRFAKASTERQVKDFASLASRNWNIQLDHAFRGDVRSGVVDCVGTFDRGAYVHLVYVPDNLAAIVREGLESVHSLGVSLTELTGRTATSLSSRSDYRRGLTLLVHGGVGRPFVAEFSTPPRSWRLLCLSIADFCTLSWETGISALRAWKVLNQRHLLEKRGMYIQSVGGFMDLYGFLRARHFDFVPRQFAMVPGESVSIWPGFAGPMRQSLRADVDLHGALGPDGKTWVEIQRKTMGPSLPVPNAAPIYASRNHAEDGYLLACVETEQRPWWVSASGRDVDASQRVAIYGVWESTMNLVSRLAPLFERHLRIPTSRRTVLIQLRFADIRDYAGTIEKSAGAPVPLRIDVKGHTATIDYLVVHLHRFAQADNVADRDLASVLVRAAFKFANESAPNERVVTQWVERVIPSGSARSFHMTPVRTAAEQIYSSVAFPEPRLQMPEDRAWSHLRLTHDASYEGARGPLSDDVVGKVLKDIVGAIWTRINDKLATLERRSVVELALQNWEAILKERAEWQRAAAALLAIHEDDDAVIGMANQRENARSVAGLAYRVIAEMALCAAPYGRGSLCAAADLDELMAEVCRLLDCAGQSDAHYHKLAPSAPIAHANGSLEFGRPVPGTLGPYWMSIGERNFRRDAAQYGEPFRTGQYGVVPEQEFELAFLAEFGATLGECALIVDWLIEEALRRRTIQFTLSKDNVIEKLKALGLCDPERAYRQFVLAPRRKWDESHPVGAKEKDWYPWRYNRRLSVLRRPLLQLSTEEDSMVLLSPARFEQSMQYITQAAGGRLPGNMFDSRAMKRYIGRMVDKYGHEFNRQVGARCRDLGWKTAVEVPMTYFGAGSDFGDLDVVAWRKESDVVYAIECKWLRMDRTIGEVGERLTEYSVGVRRGGEKMSAMERHLRRVAYLRTEGRSRVVELTGQAGPRVEVRSALVTDIPTPMQFHEEHASSLHVVTDYATLDSALAESDDLVS